jgi:hypothetical protein
MRVEMFLQVTNLSEITNHQEMKILREAYLSKILDTGLPAISHYSTSYLNWPFQEFPPRKAWKRWHLYLQHFTNAVWELHQPLGPWYDKMHEQSKWYYVHQGRRILHFRDQDTCTFEPTLSRTRNRQK